MTIALAGSLIFFVLITFALIFSIIKASAIAPESFPNRGRFFTGLSLWLLCGILAIFVSFPGYANWFVPIVYPVLLGLLISLFLIGFFMLLTTLVAFPLHIDSDRKDIAGRSDRIALLESIREIASQPFPLTEIFNLTLREMASFLVLQKGAIFLANPSRREMYLAAHIGLEADELHRLERFPMGTDIISRSSSEQMPFISGDIGSADSVTRTLFWGDKKTIRSAAAIPLYARDRSLGVVLFLSDKPYRFEKRDRMLLAAAADAIASVAEVNRMSREVSKLTQLIDLDASRLKGLQAIVEPLTDSKKQTETMTACCQYLVDRYNLPAARVMRVSQGSLTELARFEGQVAGFSENESYRVAVVDAVRQNKMIVLNQEARSEGGDIYISRSTLVCPFTIWRQGEFVLLVEASGSSLPLNDTFLADIGGLTAVVKTSLNLSEMMASEKLTRKAITALLSILKINVDTTPSMTFKLFLEESSRILPEGTSAVIFGPDRRMEYKALEGFRLNCDSISDYRLVPGEGPIGKSAATGEVLELSGRGEVDDAWADLDTANRDMMALLFGEKGMPTYQLFIPIVNLDKPVAVIAIFDHSPDQAFSSRTKGMMLLAAQLLSIRMSMAGIDLKSLEGLEPEAWPGARPLFNRLNNELATVIGRAQLLERQSDISGRTRYAAGEILKAAESAARVIKKVQKDIPDQSTIGDSPSDVSGFWSELDDYLAQRLVTGNLYMFDDNRAVMLRREISEHRDQSPFGDELWPVIRFLLNQFVNFIGEGEEVVVKSDLDDRYFYISLFRGTGLGPGRFQPDSLEFGAPDVLPGNLIEEKMIGILVGNRGEVSFDRFGRQPTYLSFRFPLEPASTQLSSTRDETKESKVFTILAIDDQQMILDLLSGICQSLGVNLQTQRDPKIGMEIIKHNKYDIVMVDLVMGQVSGWDVAAEVKKYSPETPVIMMTGWGIDISEKEISDRGVDFTLSKPFKIEQLTEIIRRATRKHISY